MTRKERKAKTEREVRRLVNSCIDIYARDADGHGSMQDRLDVVENYLRQLAIDTPQKKGLYKRAGREFSDLFADAVEKLMEEEVESGSDVEIVQ